MKFIEERTKTLTDNEISEFILDHLPYRIKILETVNPYRSKLNTDQYWPSIYESAQITCRLFIEFFGFGVIDDDPKLIPQRKYFTKDGVNTYEVKIKDLGFDFVEINELTSEERELLAHAYQAGNRATAHLTYKTPFIPDPNKVLKATSIILRLIKDKLNIKCENKDKSTKD